MAPTSRPRRGEAPASAPDVAPARERRAMSPAARSAKSPPPAVRASKPRGKTAAPAPAAPAQPLCPPHITLHRWAKRHKYDENGCPIYTRGEVIGDTLVHCVGVPFVYWAATLLVETATQRLGNRTDAKAQRTLAGLYAYSMGLCATFTASAVYNIVGCGAKWFTQPLRRVDHACIYLMIAGSYTPFMLLLPDWAVSPRIHNDTVLTIIWAIAALGALLKLVLARRFETPGLILYVALGCAVVSFTHAVLDGFAGHWRLLLEFLKSGACYLGGLVFYLDDDIPQSNALWHTCVLAGAVLHTRIVYNIVALGNERYPLP